MRRRAYGRQDAAFRPRERFREVVSEVDLPELTSFETASARSPRGLREVVREVEGLPASDLAHLAGGSFRAPAREVAKGPPSKHCGDSAVRGERITVVGVVAAAAEEQLSGLLGWLTLEIGLLRVHGVTLRRTRSGRLSLGFPCRRDGRGDRHPVVRPLGAREREAIERAVLAALGELEVVR